MAHVDGGYVITTSQRNIEKACPISEDTLKQIANLLEVNDVTDIRTIFVYAAPE
jgi:hypothetical protein